MSINAYRKTIAHTEQPRQIERRLLSEVTAELKDHIDFDILQNPEGKLSALSDGLRTIIMRNQKIWQALMHDLMESENLLEPALRANLISIALWVDRHSTAVLKGDKKIMPLITVNLSIIRGLSGDYGNVGE